LITTTGRVPNHRALRKEASDYIKTAPIDITKSPAPEMEHIAKRLEYIEKILGIS